MTEASTAPHVLFGSSEEERTLPYNIEFSYNIEHDRRSSFAEKNTEFSLGHM